MLELSTEYNQNSIDFFRKRTFLHHQLLTSIHQFSNFISNKRGGGVVLDLVDNDLMVIILVCITISHAYFLFIGCDAPY